MKSKWSTGFAADLHRLFEQGYLTVTTEYTLDVSDRLRHDYTTAELLSRFRKPDFLPAAETERPTRDLLAWHNQNVFLQ